MSVTAVPLQPVKRRYLVWLWLGLLAAVLLAAGLAWASATPGGLQFQELRAGSGPSPTDTDVALIGYVGKRPDGSVFDQNAQAPMPVASVVPGFSQALKRMQKGGKYRIVIPPELGYGAPRPAGAPPLQGEAAELAKIPLTFEVELIDFLPESVVRQMQMQQMMGGAPGAPGAPPMPGAPPPQGVPGQR